MSGLLCLKWNNHSSSFLKKLGVIYTKEIYCDSTIACRDKFYPVHRLVLSTCSEYFEEIFDRVQCKHPFIIVKDIAPAELEALLSYMYNGEVHVLQETLPGLIRAAETLKIKGLAVPEAPFSTEHGALNKLKEKLDAAFPSVPRKRIRRDSGESSRTNSNSQEIWPLSETNSEKLQKNVSEQKSKLDNQSSTCEKEDNNEVNEIKVETVEEKVDVSYDVPNLESFTPADSLAVPSGIPQDDLLPHSVDDPALNSEVNTAQCSSWDGIVNMNLNTNIAQKEGSQSSLEQESNPTSIQNLDQTTLDNLNVRVASVRSLKESLEKKRKYSLEKRFTCQYCPLKFQNRTNLTHHLHTHTGERPFSCPVCPYKAIQSNNLRTHFLIHTGEKPFKCPYCDYSSNQRVNIKRHCQKRHDDKPQAK